MMNVLWRRIEKGSFGVDVGGSYLSAQVMHQELQDAVDLP